MKYVPKVSHKATFYVGRNSVPYQQLPHSAHFCVNRLVSFCVESVEARVQLQILGGAAMLLLVRRERKGGAIILEGKYADKHPVALNLAMITSYKQGKSDCAKHAYVATMHGMKLSYKGEVRKL